MFRLVLIYQLVLSLLVGPVLCCCAATRLGHEPSSPTPSSSKSERKHCCGESPSKDTGRSTPDEKPNGPEKCPCKDAPGSAVTVPETPVTMTDALTVFAGGLLAFDAPLPVDGSFASSRRAIQLGYRSSALTSDDLLYAHHNLRC